MAWLRWAEVKKIAGEREVCFWGRSEDWIPKCLPHITADFIIDSNDHYNRTEYYDIPVYDIAYIEKHSANKPYVVITTGDYLNVAEVLREHGFESGLDYCYCPEYYDFHSLVDLRNQEFSIIFTSGDYKSGKGTRVSHLGGGIFLGKFSALATTIDVLVEGQYRGLIKYLDGYAAVEYNKCRIDIFDKAFRHLSSINLPRPHFCGLAWDNKNRNFYVANAATDIVHVLNESGDEIDQILFGSKSSEEADSHYHINDIEIYGDNLFVSYFSESGYWKYDVFDGGVAAIDIETKEKKVLYRELWQPHTPKIIMGKLHILDSFRGNVHNRIGAKVAELPGFIRGIDYKDGKYFIGQSEDMYMSRKKGLSNNIMNNAGIWVFDADSKGSRFYDCAGICNIHTLMLIE